MEVLTSSNVWMLFLLRNKYAEPEYTTVKLADTHIRICMTIIVMMSEVNIVIEKVEKIISTRAQRL